jgi:hypothetical protein
MVFLINIFLIELLLTDKYGFDVVSGLLRLIKVAQGQ